MEIQNGTMRYELTSTGFGGPVDTLCTPTSWRMGAKETDFHDIYTCTTYEIETTTCAQPHSQVKWPGSGTMTFVTFKFPTGVQVCTQMKGYFVWSLGMRLHLVASQVNRLLIGFTYIPRLHPIACTRFPYLISIQCTHVVNSNIHCDIVPRLDRGGRNTQV